MSIVSKPHRVFCFSFLFATVSALSVAQPADEPLAMLTSSEEIPANTTEAPFIPNIKPTISVPVYGQILSAAPQPEPQPAPKKASDS